MSTNTDTEPTAVKTPYRGFMIHEKFFISNDVSKYLETLKPEARAAELKAMWYGTPGENGYKIEPHTLFWEIEGILQTIPEDDRVDVVLSDIMPREITHEERINHGSGSYALLSGGIEKILKTIPNHAARVRVLSDILSCPLTQIAIKEHPENFLYAISGILENIPYRMGTRVKVLLDILSRPETIEAIKAKPDTFLEVKKYILEKIYKEEQKEAKQALNRSANLYARSVINPLTWQARLSNHFQRSADSAGDGKKRNAVKQIQAPAPEDPAAKALRIAQELSNLSLSVAFNADAQKPLECKTDLPKMIDEFTIAMDSAQDDPAMRTAYMACMGEVQSYVFRTIDDVLKDEGLSPEASERKLETLDEASALIGKAVVKYGATGRELAKDFTRSTSDTDTVKKKANQWLNAHGFPDMLL